MKNMIKHMVGGSVYFFFMFIGAMLLSKPTIATDNHKHENQYAAYNGQSQLFNQQLNKSSTQFIIETPSNEELKKRSNTMIQNILTVCSRIETNLEKLKYLMDPSEINNANAATSQEYEQMQSFYNDFCERIDSYIAQIQQTKKSAQEELIDCNYNYIDEIFKTFNFDLYPDTAPELCDEYKNIYKTCKSKVSHIMDFLIQILLLTNKSIFNPISIKIIDNKMKTNLKDFISKIRPIIDSETEKLNQTVNKIAGKPFLRSQYVQRVKQNFKKNYEMYLHNLSNCDVGIKPKTWNEIYSDLNNNIYNNFYLANLISSFELFEINVAIPLATSNFFELINY